MLHIAVIGCGIAGPAAALFLKKLNADVTVFDKVDNLKPLRDALHGIFCKTPIIKQQMLLSLACMKTGYFKSIPLDQYQPLFRPINE